MDQSRCRQGTKQDDQAAGLNQPTASMGQVSSHHISRRARIWSRILRVPARRSSCVPLSAAGSGKLQCSRLVTPAKIGQRSALLSSQTVITYANSSPDLKTSNTDGV